MATAMRRRVTVWQNCNQSITDLERHLRRSVTRIIKFFLHRSKDEQRNRCLARIDEAQKNWKVPSHGGGRSYESLRLLSKSRRLSGRPVVWLGRQRTAPPKLEAAPG